MAAGRTARGGYPDINARFVARQEFKRVLERPAKPAHGVAPVTAKARSLPALTYWIADAKVPK